MCSEPFPGTSIYGIIITIIIIIIIIIIKSLFNVGDIYIHI